ncbi:MAG: hypothetical protein Q4B28_00745 [bacterium]|nr:hypothetical protein [bacterium]
MAVAAPLLLAACGKAPELSFEQTLKVYDQNTETMVKIVELLNTQDAILQTSTKGTLSLDANKDGNGKLVLDSVNITHPQTKDSEGNLDLNLDANLGEDLMGVAGNINLKLGLKTLVKDYQIYLQLSELTAKASDELQAQIGFFTAMLEGFKQKWLKIDEPEIKTLIQNMGTNIPMLQNKDLYKNKPEYYTGVEKTTYEGQPAWKVDFNMEVVKAQAKHLIQEVFNQNSSMYSGTEMHEAMQEELQTTMAKMNELVDTLSFENVDAYFVIYAEDKVKFVVKHMDVVIPEQIKITLSSTITKDTDKIKMAITPLTADAEEQLNLDLEINENGKGKYGFTLKVSSPLHQQPVSLAGTLAFQLSDKAFSVKPDVKVAFDGINLQFQGEYKCNLLDNHSFVAPENAENLADVLGGLFGFGAGDEVMMDDDTRAMDDEEVVEETLEHTTQ